MNNEYIINTYLSPDFKVFVSIRLLDDNCKDKEAYKMILEARTTGELFESLHFLSNSERALYKKFSISKIEPKLIGTVKTFRKNRQVLNSYYKNEMCPYEKGRKCSKFDLKECTSKKYRLQCKIKKYY
jgi:hypothetical protein